MNALVNCSATWHKEISAVKIKVMVVSKSSAG